MKTIYYSGMPYSPSLYHYGTKGMHWYQRLYQNPDGSLTPLGRVHYGVGKAAKATGRVAGKAIVATGKAAGKAGKAVGKQVVNRVKARHPWMMSDEELIQRSRRVNMERNYQDAMRSTRSTRGKELAISIMEDGGKVMARSLFKGIGEKIEAKMRLRSELKAAEAKKDAEMDRYISDQIIKAKGDVRYNNIIQDAKNNRAYYDSKVKAENDNAYDAIRNKFKNDTMFEDYVAKAQAEAGASLIKNWSENNKENYKSDQARAYEDSYLSKSTTYGTQQIRKLTKEIQDNYNGYTTEELGTKMTQLNALRAIEGLPIINFGKPPKK